MPNASCRVRKAFKEQTVAEATGQTARFLKILEEYKKAPDVTRTRLYLETMERVLGGANKIIIDSNAVRASCRSFRSASAGPQRRGQLIPSATKPMLVNPSFQRAEMSVRAIAPHSASSPDNPIQLGRTEEGE